MHEEKPDLAKGAMKAMQDLYDVVTHDILSSTLRYCCDFMILVLNDLIVEKIMEFDSNSSIKLSLLPKPSCLLWNKVWLATGESNLAVAS